VRRRADLVEGQDVRWPRWCKNMLASPLKCPGQIYTQSGLSSRGGPRVRRLAAGERRIRTLGPVAIAMMVSLGLSGAALFGEIHGPSPSRSAAECGLPLRRRGFHRDVAVNQ